VGRRLWVGILTVLLTGGVSAAQPRVVRRPTGIRWVAGIEEARITARITDAPVIVYVCLSNHAACLNFEEEVLAHRTFRKLSGLFVMVRVDARRRKDVAQAFQITRYPTLLFLDSAGERLYTLDSQMTANRVVQYMVRTFLVSMFNSGRRAREAGEVRTAIRRFKTLIAIGQGTVQTREAALAVIRLAAELGEKVGDEEVCFMQSHMTMLTQTMLSLGGTYVLRKSCDQAGLDAEMVAIIDLAGLTRDLQGEFQSRLESSPVGDAAFSMEMAGMTVGFVVRSGRLDIVDKKQKVHRKLPRWIVTRLVMGYYSGDDVLTMGPLPWDRSDGKTPDDPKLDNRPLELPHREAALFRALFPKLWPTSLPDPDVWPWVIGKPHPKYQGEEHKTPEMKAQIDALRFPWMGC